MVDIHTYVRTERGARSSCLYPHNVVPFVFCYNTEPDRRFPTHLLDVARAMKYIRDDAEKYSINPDCVFALGFSAGGRLCGMLAVHHTLVEKMLSYPENTARPKDVILSYPVATAWNPTHRGPYFQQLGKDIEEYTEKEKNLLSIEKNITESTPPAFIWHTSEDNSVPIYGSLAVAGAYHRVKTPVELHIFPYE